MKETVHILARAVRGVGRRFGGVVKAVAALAAISFAGASQAEIQTAEANGYTWSFELVNGKARITSGSVTTAAISPKPTSDNPEVIIPSTIGGYPVTCIGGGAFYGCGYMTSVSIPSMVTTLDQSAFANCGLTSVRLPDAVLEVPKYAFASCSALKKVILPYNVTSIAQNAFSHCSGIEEVYLPRSFMPSGTAELTSTLKQAFPDRSADMKIWYCEKAKTEAGTWYLQSLRYADANEFGYSTYTRLQNFDGGAAVPLVSAGEELVIPAYLGSNYAVVQGFGESAFSYRQMGSIKCNGSFVTNIDARAFSHCSSLTSMEIPSEMTRLGDYTFDGCTSLTNVTLPAGLTYVGGCAFNGCTSLESLFVPDNVTSIGSSAFRNSGLSFISLPGRFSSTLTSSSSQFSGCPSDLRIVFRQKVGDYTWCYSIINGNEAIIQNDSLTAAISPLPSSGADITVPNTLGGKTVKHIGVGAFDSCSGMSKVTLPASVKTILGYAFYECNRLSSVNLSSLTSLTTIGALAFYNCNSLSVVEVPKGVTSLGMFAFYSCDNLTYAYLDVSLRARVLSDPDPKIFGNCPDVTVKYTCLVDFDGQGGTSYSRNCYFGEAIGTLPTPKRADYSFDGWFTAASGGTKITASTTVEGNATYYAHWTSNTPPATMCTITFNPNGGTVDETERVLEKWSVIGEMPVPQRSGYVCDGWYTKGGSLVTATAQISGSVTLYAHWVLSCTVTFDPNGGTVDETSRNVPKGTAIGEMPVPKLFGYEFVGWFTKGGSRITETVKVSANVTLYAHWTLEGCLLTFNPAGGTVAEQERLVPRGGVIGKMPVPVRSGYEFLGWFTKAGTEIKETARASTDVTLYAHWALGGCTVTFDPVGGTVDETSRSVPKGTAIGTLPVPRRNGYVFEGWFTKAGTRITETAKVSAAVTLYAHWAVVTCTVSFDPVGGTIGEASRKVPKGTAIGEMPVPVRSGYTFQGWFTKAGSAITAATRVSGDVTVYARWAR